MKCLDIRKEKQLPSWIDVIPETVSSSLVSARPKQCGSMTYFHDRRRVDDARFLIERGDHLDEAKGWTSGGEHLRERDEVSGFISKFAVRLPSFSVWSRTLVGKGDARLRRYNEPGKPVTFARARELYVRTDRFVPSVYLCVTLCETARCISPHRSFHAAAAAYSRI